MITGTASRYRALGRMDAARLHASSALLKRRLQKQWSGLCGGPAPPCRHQRPAPASTGLARLFQVTET
jgi:hypothetical protein